MIFEKPTYDSLVEENDIIRTREQGKEGNTGEETVNKEGGWPKRRNNRNRLDRRLFGSGGEGQRRVESRTRPVLAFSRLVTVSRLWGAMEGDGLDGLRRHHTDSLYLSLSLSPCLESRVRTSLRKRFFPVRRISRAPIRDSRCVLVSFRGCTETAVQMARRSKRAVHTTR